MFDHIKITADAEVGTQLQIYNLYGSFDSDDQGHWKPYYSQVSDQVLVPNSVQYEVSTEDQFPLQPYTESPSARESTALLDVKTLKPFRRNFIFWRPESREIPSAFVLTYDADKMALTVGEVSTILVKIQVMKSPGSDWVMPDPEAFVFEVSAEDIMRNIRTTIGHIIYSGDSVFFYATLTGIVEDQIPVGAVIRMEVTFPTRTSGYVQVLSSVITMLNTFQHRMSYRVVDAPVLSESSSGSWESLEIGSAT